MIQYATDVSLSPSLLCISFKIVSPSPSRTKTDDFRRDYLGSYVLLREQSSIMENGRDPKLQ